MNITKKCCYLINYNFFLSFVILWSARSSCRLVLRLQFNRILLFLISHLLVFIMAFFILQLWTYRSTTLLNVNLWWWGAELLVCWLCSLPFWTICLKLVCVCVCGFTFIDLCMCSFNLLIFGLIRASPMASITILNLLLYTTNENWQVVFWNCCTINVWCLRNILLIHTIAVTGCQSEGSKGLFQ